MVKCQCVAFRFGNLFVVIMLKITRNGKDYILWHAISIFFNLYFFFSKYLFHCHFFLLYSYDTCIHLSQYKKLHYHRAFNIFQVYQYFTIYTWYFFLLKFEHCSWISYTTLFKIRRYQRPFQLGKGTWYRPLLKGLLSYIIFCIVRIKILFVLRYSTLSSWPLSTQEMCPFRFQFNHDNGLAGWLT
jgi:hypothetical protein